jgi:hypothetical protein
MFYIKTQENSISPLLSMIIKLTELTLNKLEILIFICSFPKAKSISRLGAHVHEGFSMEQKWFILDIKMHRAGIGAEAK